MYILYTVDTAYLYSQGPTFARRCNAAIWPSVEIHGKYQYFSDFARVPMFVYMFPFFGYSWVQFLCFSTQNGRRKSHFSAFYGFIGVYV